MSASPKGDGMNICDDSAVAEKTEGSDFYYQPTLGSIMADNDLVTHLTLCLLIFSCNIDIQVMVSRSQMVSRAENPQDILTILFTLAVWK